MKTYPHWGASNQATDDVVVREATRDVIHPRHDAPIRTEAREDWHPLSDRRGPTEVVRSKHVLRPVGLDDRTGPLGSRPRGLFRVLAKGRTPPRKQPRLSLTRDKVN
jgi:hypothetical protein